jgi:hypothetical protein
VDENREKDVVTWKLLQDAKHYRIGDGNTRLVGEEPEPGYGKSPLEPASLPEALEQFGDDLRKFQSLLGEFGMFRRSDSTEYHPPPDPKAEARKRSRADLERKRKELRRRKR